MLNVKTLVAIAILIGSSLFGVNVKSPFTAPDVKSDVSTNTLHTNVSADTELNVDASARVGAQGQRPEMIKPGIRPNVQTQSNSNAATDARANSNANARANARGEAKIAADIAAQYNVSASDVVKLHESGWGWGEIVRLYALAKASGKSTVEIKAMHDAGQGWGQIAQTLNLSLNALDVSLGTLVSGDAH